jgi:filamentous hemagglutinin
MLKKICSLFLICIMAAYPTLSLAAAPQIPGFYGKVSIPRPLANALPAQRGNSWTGVKSITEGVDKNGVAVKVIDQDQSKAIIDWDSFNIGVNAWTRFDQKGNKNWVALNRIYDKDPSQIFGKLTADGKVFLINQNGILFGQGSQVNVHSLTASALNITKDDFLNGVLKFKAESYIRNEDGSYLALNPDVAVENQGTITAGQLGSVFLMAPHVANSGSIDAPVGQIGLVAGAGVEFGTDQSGNRTAYLMKVTNGPGIAVNNEGGRLVADTGLVGMYGREVNQSGLIRSITAIKKNGQIELFASDRIYTGPQSKTLTPISASTETADPSFTFKSGDISLKGLDKLQPVKVIEHHGMIQAPAGTVTLTAGDRVFLDAGSRTDVGGVWLDKSGDSLAFDATLNSVNLNDAYGQKDGILKGMTITTDPITGSSVGNIIGYLKTKEKTALERSTTGGALTISAASGDVIAKEGSEQDFSGGGIRYDMGIVNTTRLLCGNKVYDIGSAPQWYDYSAILGNYTRQTDKFGTTAKFSGLYFGGGAAVGDLRGAHIEGSDAGKFTVSAPTVVLDGALNGAATRGVYQTLYSASNAERDLSVAAGTEAPNGGALSIGDTQDFVTQEVEIKPRVTPSADLEPDTPLSDEKIYLSAEMINGAGLKDLAIYSYTGLTIDSGANPALAAGGSFIAKGRRIENRGQISVPGGTVSLTSKDDTADSLAGNPKYAEVEEGIILGQGSVITTAGQMVDNTLAGKAPGAGLQTGRTGGGTVMLEDWTGKGVIVGQGAVVDVSGGYLIDAKGKISGGNAGTVTLKGMEVSVAGELRGFSLPGANGGTISLHVPNVVIKSAEAAEAPAPNTLVLTADRFDESGFSNIEIKSLNDLVFQPGAVITPSHVKLAEPVPGRSGAEGGSGNYFVPRTDVAGQGDLSPDYIGATSVKLSAGTTTGFPVKDLLDNINAKLILPAGAGITTAAKGEIFLSAPSVAVAGTLSAPSGKIGLEASYGSLKVSNGASISAAGFNQGDSTTLATGGAPLDGGAVTLKATNDIIVESKASIDVSGAPAANRLVRNGDGTAGDITLASNAGSLALNYSGDLTLNGHLKGNAGMPGYKGGSFTISTGELTFDTYYTEYLKYILDVGFDALTFKGGNSIRFQEPIKLAVGRSLTLDAPEISAAGSSQVSLASPWIKLMNSGNIPGNPATGNAQLMVYGGSVDVSGAVGLSGFKNVSLFAQDDIRLTDRQYENSWKGSLATAGDLTIAAGRIYPGMTVQTNTADDGTITGATYIPSDFTVKAGGRITTAAPDTANVGTLYSAGGRLTFDAGKGIEHGGVIAAPMGEITLTSADGRVYLAPGSVLSTAGTDPVSYGTFDGISWTMPAKTRTSGNVQSVLVEQSPGKSISINGKEVIVRDGAIVDVSGGGSVFAYQFQPGIDGSKNPLQIKGRYVILPDNSVKLPGDAVYLKGGNGIAEGVYSILPMEYAFLPGAMVVTDLNIFSTPGTAVQSAEGYPTVAGYTTVRGTGTASPQLKLYSIRSAQDVLKEGHFAKTGTKAGDEGDGGKISIVGETTVLNGTLKAAGLAGYRGGVLDLSGRNITVQPEAVPLPDDFKYDAKLPVGLAGTLQVSATALSGTGAEELRLGYLDPGLASANPAQHAAAAARSTQTVTVLEGATLEAGSITLSALKSVSVESGAKVDATGSVAGSSTENGTGEVSLTAAEGKITVQRNAEVHAVNGINIDSREIDVKGEMKTDNSHFTLKGDNIYFVTGSDPGAQTGVTYITDNLWKSFGLFDNISLVSRNDLVFQGDFSITAPESLTIDAARIAGTEVVQGTEIGAKKINLLNSSGKSASLSASQAGGEIAFAADEIAVGNGNIIIDGYRSVNLAAKNNLTFLGKGSMGVAGDLDISAARVTTSFVRTGAAGSADRYQVSQFSVKADNGGITIRNSGGTAGTSTTPGGLLEISAQRVELVAGPAPGAPGGTIDIPSGQVTITATGSGSGDGITLGAGATIKAQGTTMATADPVQPEYLPGGSVTLRNANGGGGINLASGSLIDASAAGTGDAGAVSLESPAGVILAGDLKGNAAGGKGGSFALDTNTLAIQEGVNRFTTIRDKLAAGGFNDEIRIRSRAQDITLASGTTLKARDLTVTADSGAINVGGTIDATGPEGGRVELNGGTGVTLASTGKIFAGAIDSDPNADRNGGEVLLNSLGNNPGAVDFQSGAVIDVSGQGTGDYGVVTFRALRNDAGNDLNMKLAGSVTGARRVAVEGVKVYARKAGHSLTDGDFFGYFDDDGNYIPGFNEDSQTFMDNNKASIPAQFHLIPGVEVRGEGNLSLDSFWDLSPNRYGINQEPGALTLRAAGDVTLNGSLLDHPIDFSANSIYGSFYDLKKTGNLGSWGITLAAGADLDGADSLATKRGMGNLTIADGTTLYSESAPIRFASGKDTVIGSAGSVSYMINPNMVASVGTYEGAIRGETGGDLRIKGGVIQSATGDISLNVGGDLRLENGNNTQYVDLGSIRTTGEFLPRSKQTLDEIGPAGFTDYWNYHNGGDITVKVRGSVTGGASSKAWDHANNTDALYTAGLTPAKYAWSSSYVSEYGERRPTEGLAAMGGGSVEVSAGGDFITQSGTFGKGDLKIRSGGDMVGRFLVKEGDGSFQAMGNFSDDKQLIETFDGRIRVNAQGDIDIVSILNPNVTTENLMDDWDLGYTEQTSVSFASASGNVKLGGQIPYHSALYDPIANLPKGRILPGTLEIRARGDILFRNDFALAPAANGSLLLDAGGNIDGAYGDGKRATVAMSDMDPASVYGPQQNFNPGSLFLSELHSSQGLVHRGDTSPVRVTAGGDIRNLSLYAPKNAELAAGNDIRDIYFVGQNLPDSDSANSDGTTIRAGRDIFFSSATDTATKTGVEMGGGGYLLFQAGRNIDLGTTNGIMAYGDQMNRFLGSEGSDVLVLAGTNRDESGMSRTPANSKDFFDRLRIAGTEYGRLLADGDKAGAELIVRETRDELVAPLFDKLNNGTGTINMTSSKIGTTAAGGDIYILSRSQIDVGKSTFSQNTQNTGIYTAGGGGINIFSGGDVNVNESRAMTFFGGDITIWSDQGNVNAGRGSKTAVNASPPRSKWNGDVLVVVFEPPAVGSGIRTVTFDPDGFEGDLTAPAAGDGYIFAPNGAIDAGEAGIAGSKLVLGATQVLNSQNISFSAGSVGVPAASEGTVSIGALGGSSALSASGNAIEQNSAVNQAAAKYAPSTDLADDFIAKWLDVKVLSFDEDESQKKEKE